jgi:hypothetical protein
MALTHFQRRVCRLLAAQRVASGESYVAGGTALGEALSSPRLSRDIDLFHDTDAALDSSWEGDRAALTGAGFEVVVLRNRPGLIEAQVAQHHHAVVVEWTRDSAFRFFPLLAHEDFGLVLHPFDLATNKVLALAGRLEARDWVDVVLCSERLQPLGYLVWAAAGKDPGFNPASLLDHAARANRFTQEELQALAFLGDPPDAAVLARTWRRALEQAAAIVRVLPAEEAGRAVLNDSFAFFRGGDDELRAALSASTLRFHAGSIRGAFPRLVER